MFDAKKMAKQDSLPFPERFHETRELTVRTHKRKEP